MFIAAFGFRQFPLFQNPPLHPLLFLLQLLPVLFAQCDIVLFLVFDGIAGRLQLGLQAPAFGSDGGNLRFQFGDVAACLVHGPSGLGQRRLLLFDDALQAGYFFLQYRFLPGGGARDSATASAHNCTSATDSRSGTPGNACGASSCST